MIIHYTEIMGWGEGMQSNIIFLMRVVKELKYLHYHIIMADNLGNIVLGFIGIVFFILFAVIIATD